MTKTVKIEGMDEFISDLNKLSKVVRSEVSLDALEAGAQVIVAYAEDNARNKLNKHPTGNLVNSIGVRREGKTVLAGVFGVVYAKIHEFGGVIKARNAKRLVFMGADGHLISKKSVNIPARPYLRPAVDNHMADIKDAIIEALRGLIQKAVR
jgi:HK97 gp10 family phage protein